MPLELLHADEHYVAVAKPAGLVVHQAPGPGPSLLRVLREDHGLDGLTLVHRLDKDVSGVLLLGRTKAAAAAMHARWDQARKTYLALCEGAPASLQNCVDAPILEHQTGRPTRMESALRWHREQHPGAVLPPPPAPKTSAVHPAGRSSQTDYRVLEAFTVRATGTSWSWVEASPRQGRMHQIRVHLKHAAIPLAADKLYGNRAVLRTGDLLGNADDTVIFERLPLHAARLELPHPFGAGPLKLEAPPPPEFARALELLRKAGA